jgi:hypothetical protein
MDTFVERVAALDVHKDSLAACVRLPGKGRRRRQEKRSLVASRLVVYGPVEVVFRGCRGARAVGERGATAAGPGDS